MDKTQTTGRTSDDTDALIALLDIADNLPGAGAGGYSSPSRCS